MVALGGWLRRAGQWVKTFGRWRAWALQDVSLQLVGLGILAPTVGSSIRRLSQLDTKGTPPKVADSTGGSAHALAYICVFKATGCTQTSCTS